MLVLLMLDFHFGIPKNTVLCFFRLAMRFERPTLSQLLGVVHDSVRHLLQGVDCPGVLFAGHNFQFSVWELGHADQQGLVPLDRKSCACTGS